MHLRGTDGRQTLAFVPELVLAIVPEVVLVVHLVQGTVFDSCRTLLGFLELSAPSACTGTACLQPIEEAESKLEVDPVLDQADAHMTELVASRV